MNSLNDARSEWTIHGESGGHWLLLFEGVGVPNVGGVAGEEGKEGRGNNWCSSAVRGGARQVVRCVRGEVVEVWRYSSKSKQEGIVDCSKLNKAVKQNQH